MRDESTKEVKKKKAVRAKTKPLRMPVLFMKTGTPSLTGFKNEIPYLSRDICPSFLFP